MQRQHLQGHLSKRFRADKYTMVCGETMTRIKFSGLACAFCLLITACAGGNAIEEGVPSAALQTNQPAAFPPPASPLAAGAAPTADSTTAPVFPQTPASAQVSTAPTATAPPASALVTGAPANTGTFPNSGVERRGATQQLSDAERDQKIAELRALQAQQQANTISPAASRARLLELQRLAKTHSRDTIRTIEAQ